MCRGKAEVWDEPEESRCREAAVLAEDDRGCSAERDVVSGILPAAPRERKPVLLVATQTESRPSGAEQAECSRTEQPVSPSSVKTVWTCRPDWSWCSRTVVGCASARAFRRDLASGSCGHGVGE